MRLVRPVLSVRDRHPAPRRVDGYTLVELLTVTLILAVLAAIAIPMVIAQRQSAWRSSTASDVRNTAIIVEAAGPSALPVAIAQDGQRVAVLAEAQPDDEVSVVQTSGATVAGELQVVAETRSSPGVLLTLARGSDTHFCLCGYHERLGSDPAAVYDSTRGGLVDACELPSGGCAVPTGPQAPGGTVVSFLGVTFNEETGRWERTGNPSHFAQTMTDGQPITSGSLILTGVEASFGHGTRGGWALAYGTYDNNGRLSDGYTVQFDRALNQFVVSTWSGGNERNLSNRPSATPPPGFQWDAAADVQLDVRDGQLTLHVDGQQMISHQLPDGMVGSLGIRTWHDTALRYDHAELRIDG